MGRPPKAETVMATKTHVGAEDFVRLRDSVGYAAFLRHYRGAALASGPVPWLYPPPTASQAADTLWYAVPRVAHRYPRQQRWCCFRIDAYPSLDEYRPVYLLSFVASFSRRFPTVVTLQRCSSFFLQLSYSTMSALLVGRVLRAVA